MGRVEVFNESRPLLFSIAYRMLGSAMEAEDMVQETFLRWQGVAPDEVKSVRAYLTTIITRLCLDHLRSARVQRESYIGPWLPEPLVTDQSAETASGTTLADSVSMAFLVLLENLSPTERAVFLLHEVFDYNYAEIARIIDKSEANCRQIGRRARQYVADRRPRFDSSIETQQLLVTKFMEACATGDLPGLVTILADDITAWSDGGGKAYAARKPIHGAEKVARFILNVSQKAPEGFVPIIGWVNHQPAIISYVDGRPIAVMVFDIVDGKIQALRSILNPDKLKRLPRLE